MRTANPVFRNIERSQVYEGVRSATYRGIVAKTAILLISAIISGYLAVTYVGINELIPFLLAALIIAFISVLIATMSIRLAQVFGLIYALSIGVLLGVITSLFNSFVPGVALAAVIATATIFTVMLFLYSSRTIRVTPRFRKVMFGALISIFVFMVLFGIMNMFVNIEFNTPISLGISAIFIVFGAFMLTLDFDRAESIVESGADKRYEWVIAVGLMVTLVWIYIELLRFLAIIALNRS